MSSPLRIPGSSQVSVEENPNLFAVFALLNVTGYHADNGWKFSFVRTQVRMKLAGRAGFWTSRLEKEGLLAALHLAGGARLMDLLPLFPRPLLFEKSAEAIEYTTDWQRRSLTALSGLEPLLREFVAQENIAVLWEEQKAARTAAAALLHPLTEPLARLAERSGEPRAGPALRILLWPSLLDAHHRGYSLSSPDCTWLFIGPIREPGEARAIVTHELLHRWVDPEAERVAALSLAKDPMPEARARFRVVAEAYPDLSIWIAETVVRAMTAWLLPQWAAGQHGSVDHYLAFWEQNGFVGITRANRHFASSPERVFPTVIKEAVRLVQHGVAGNSAAE